MTRLWKERGNYRKFDPKRHHISDTCGRSELFIPYEREYTTLNGDQLLQLINDAKQNKWQALDLTNCGLKYLPDELWELCELKMLYLGNYSQNLIHDEEDSSDDRINAISKLPRKIELLTNLKVLSLAQMKIQFEEKR